MTSTTIMADDFTLKGKVIDEEENALEAYHVEYQEYRSKFKAWQIKESERLSLMKIVIPDDLQAIYETVCSLEK